MKNQRTLILAASIFALALSAFPHHAAADSTTAPPPPSTTAIQKMVDKASPKLYAVISLALSMLLP